MNEPFPAIATIAALASLFGIGISCHYCVAQSAAASEQGTSAMQSSVETQLGPPLSDRPCVVRIGFYLESLNAIDEEAETFEFTGVLTVKWKDERQAFDPVEVGVNEKMYQGDYQFNELSPTWYPQIVLVNRTGLFERSATILRVEPDGSSTLSQTIDAIAKTTLDLRAMPFDTQSLDAVFEVFGFDRSEVKLLAAELPDDNDSADMRIPQWTLLGIGSSVVNADDSESGESAGSPRIVLTVRVERQSLFLLRLIVMPLLLIVMLSWSVFWMDRSSLGDRINLSFVGILTAVAYQIVVGDIMPRISYQTLMNGFLNVSFLTMCAAAIVNLVVGAADKAGNYKRGDLIDRRCRVIFPLTYFGLIGIAVAIALMRS